MEKSAGGEFGRHGRIIDLQIEDAMNHAYIDYAMSVIGGRALPDARDGLKPVHRRILYSMYELGLYPSKPFKKSASVVGDVLGKYHPHGDSAVYDALVRMVQDFSLRYPLIEGQGNFGNIDGDNAAAYRYTEARLAPIALEVLSDIDKETVTFVPNFDDRLAEPHVLPSKIPNLLINGSTGIAVGMATNVPPHNLNEVGAAVALLCERPDALDDEVYRLIKGPDFPTGARVIQDQSVRDFYRTGQGRMVMRARVHVETSSKGRTTLVFTEIPYGVNKTTILDAIVRGVRNKKITDIADLRDESDRDGIRIVIELKRDGVPARTLKQLYKQTALQSTFGAQLRALVNGEPKILTFRRALEIFIDHRLEVVVRRARYELKKAEDRAHILEGYLIAIDAIDRVVEIIKGSETADEARRGLIAEFDLTEIQAQAILDLQLRRLTALDVKKLRQELEELRVKIADLQAFLASPDRQRMMVRDETLEMVAKYGGSRRTSMVSKIAAEEIEQKAAEEYVRVYVSSTGKAWSEPVGMRSRARTLKGDDPAVFSSMAQSTERLVVFTSSGQYYPLEVADVISGGTRPRPLPSLISGLKAEERILWVGTPDSLSKGENLQMLFITAKGHVKATSASEYSSPRANGVLAVGLMDEDSLVDIILTYPDSEMILATRNGNAIRFSLSEVPEQGRSARGVKCIRLASGDEVVAAGIVSRELGVVFSSGVCKRIPTDELPLQRRGGVGVKLSGVGGLGSLIWARPIAGAQAFWAIRAGQEEYLPYSTDQMSLLSAADAGELLLGLDVPVLSVVDAPDLLSQRLLKRVEQGVSSDEDDSEDLDPMESEDGVPVADEGNVVMVDDDGQAVLGSDADEGDADPQLSIL